MLTPVWKYYKDTEYIDIDFSNVLTDQDAIDLVTTSVKEGLKRPDKSIRALLSIQGKGRKVSPSAMRTIKVLGKEVQPKMHKSAIVGSVGMMTLLLKLYTSYTGSRMKFFTNKEAALNYLTTD